MNSQYHRSVKGIRDFFSKLKKEFPEEFKKIDSNDLNRVQSFFESMNDLLDWDKMNAQISKTSQMSDGYPLSEEMLDSKGKNAIAIYSDGACRGNPGPGGWGCLAQNKNGEILFELKGSSALTTNNQMEMVAAIEGLKEVASYVEQKRFKFDDLLFLYSDSRYVVDGLEKWIPGWKKRGWKKADKKPPENLELWQSLDQEASKFPNLKNFWVKGHSGHPQNDRCDELANIALDEMLK